MCEWFSGKLFINDRFTEDFVLFSDEAMFYVNGKVNRHNSRYWSQSNPRWFGRSKQQVGQKVMVAMVRFMESTCFRAFLF